MWCDQRRISPCLVVKFARDRKARDSPSSRPAPIHERDRDGKDPYAFAPAGGVMKVDEARNLLLLAGTTQELGTMLDVVKTSMSIGSQVCHTAFTI